VGYRVFFRALPTLPISIKGGGKLRLTVALILIALLVPVVSSQQTAEEWFYKGVDLYDQGNYDEAIKCYDEAIKLNPQYAEAWSSKGNALVNQGDYDEAIKCYDEAIKLNPQYAKAWYNKGTAQSL